MATFPALVPSSRMFTPGGYPHTAFVGMNGKQNRVRHGNVMLQSSLRLTFVGVTQSDMLSIKAHYDAQQGSFLSFDIPSELTDGLTAAEYTLTNYSWRYAEPPQVADFCGPHHDVSVTLQSVPPEGAVVGGINEYIQTSFAPGAGSASVSLAGLTQTIAASLTAGLASADLITADGLNKAVTTLFSPGAATGNVSVAGLNLTVTASLTAGAASIPSDPDFSSVSLLLHMDGTNGSTAFTDNSSNAHTVTAYGDAQISTAQSKWGGASGSFDGTDDYLMPPASSTLAMGTSNFTIEAWVRFNNFSASQAVFSYGTTQINIYANSSSKLLAYVNGTAIGAVTALSANTWYHVALCRSSSTVRLFINGTQEGSTTASTNFTNNQMYIGRRSDGTYQLNGYIDDLRVTKVARYTSAFTPPSGAFPNS